MPLFKTWKHQGATWGIWKVTESAEELRTMLQKSCNDNELNQYKSESRKMEYLAVRALLKALVGREYAISHYPSGKPYLQDSSLFFTVSHTKGYVAVGLHPEREVGIDIEQVAERVRRVSVRFVRSDELPNLDVLEASEQLYELLLVWSAKESIFKVLNASEVDFLLHLRIAPFNLQKDGGTFTGYEYRTEQKNIYQLNYMIHSDFVCTYLLG